MEKIKRKAIREEIQIPDGISAKIDGNEIVLIKEGIEQRRKMNFPVKLQDNVIVIEHKSPTKKDKRLIKSLAAHIRNLILGLQKKFVYKLQICNVHFPMTVSVQGDSLVIKNFLGEIKERRARIMPGTSVKIDKDIIIVESANKEMAGQTALNIEKSTKPKNRDRRVFQDGIWIIEKPERERFKNLKSPESQTPEGGLK